MCVCTEQRGAAGLCYSAFILQIEFGFKCVFTESYNQSRIYSNFILMAYSLLPEEQDDAILTRTGVLPLGRLPVVSQ